MPAFQAAAVICGDGVTSEPFTLFVDRPRSYRDADAASRDDNALRIVEESILTLNAPYAALVPTTPDNIADVLRQPAEPARHAQLSGLQVQPVTREGQLSRLASDLKQLAQAKRVNEAREELLRGELGAQRVGQPRLWDDWVADRRPSGSARARFLESRGVQNPSRRPVTSCARSRSGDPGRCGSAGLLERRSIAATTAEPGGGMLGPGSDSRVRCSVTERQQRTVQDMH